MQRFSRLRQLIYRSSSLRQAVGILFVTVLISNILGFLRNMVIANRVGLSYGSLGVLDTYYAAFTLPDLLYSIIIVGALSSAILPILSELDTKKNEQEFWRTFNTILSAGLVVVAGGLVFLYFLMPFLLSHLFVGFNQEKISFTVQLAQILLLSPLFFTISQISTSALQAKKVFAAPALAPIVYNLAIIAAALLIPSHGLSVLVVGVIIGAAGHFLIQLPALLSLGWQFKFSLNFRHPHLQEIYRLMVPRTIALTSNQLLLIAFYRLASNLPDGSITIYKLTDDLQTAPVLLLGNTLAMAILPDFVRHLSSANGAKFTELVGKSIRLIAYIFLPASAFLLIYRVTLIDLYISIGHTINEAEVSRAAWTFAWFVVSLPWQAAILLLSRAYFARRETYRPMVYAVLGIVLSWALAVFFTNVAGFGVMGLSLAYSIGSILTATLLWFGLGLKMRVLWQDSLGRWNLPSIMAATLVTATIWLMFHRISNSVLPKILILSPSKQNLTELVVALILGLGFYLTWSKVFNLEQWQLLRIRRTTSTTT